MTQREKLVELVEDSINKWDFYLYHFDDERLYDDESEEKKKSFEEFISDYLLENGVIVPPCKVGDTAWLVFSPKYPANPADKGKWYMTEDGVQRIICGVKGLSIETWNMGTISAKEIGKKLFFTKEEAEKALAEKEV